MVRKVRGSAATAWRGVHVSVSSIIANLIVRTDKPTRTPDDQQRRAALVARVGDEPGAFGEFADLAAIDPACELASSSCPRNRSRSSTPRWRRDSRKHLKVNGN